MIADYLLALLNASWRIGLLLALMLALRPWLRRRISSGSYFAIWTVLGVLLVFPIAVPTTFSPYNLIPRYEPKPPTTAVPPQDVGVLQPTVQTAVAASGVTAAATQGSARIVAEEHLKFAISAPQILLGLWIGGGLLLAGWHLLSTLSFKRQIRRDRRDLDLHTATILRDSAAKLGIRGEVRACVTGAVSTPAVHGLLRPELLLPTDFSGQLDDSQLRLVLLHELGHIHRRDLWALATLRIASFVHWFNPLVWMASAAARRDCEHACDEYVLHNLPGAEPGDYAATLVSIFRLLGNRVPVRHGLGVIGQSARIAGRLGEIIDRRPDSAVRKAISLTATVLVAIVGISCGKAGQLASTDLPAGWSTPTLGATGNPANPPSKYTVGVDPRTTHSGAPSIFIQAPPDAGSMPGRMVFRIVDAAPYRNKRVRYNVWLKTEDAGASTTTFAALVSLPQPRIMKQAVLGDQSPRGTTEWKKYTLVIDVPESAETLQYRINLMNGGTVFLADPSLEIVGTEVPVTPPLARTSLYVPQRSPMTEFTLSNPTPPNTWFVNSNAPGKFDTRITAEGPGGEAASYTASHEEPTLMERWGVVFGNTTNSPFGGMMQTIEASEYLGKRVEVSAMVRTKDATTGGGHIWMRIDGMVDGNRTSLLDNTGRHPVMGTQDWRRVSVTMDIPMKSTLINFGYFLNGKGAMWASDFKFMVLGAALLPASQAGAPEAAAKGPDTKAAAAQDVVDIGITSSASLEWNGSMLTRIDQFIPLLTKFKADHPQGAVVIHVDRTLHFSQVFGYVVNEVRKVGIQSVRIETSVPGSPTLVTQDITPVESDLVLDRSVPVPRSDLAVVELSDPGVVFWDQVSIPASELAQRLKTLHEKSPAAKVLITADERAGISDTIKVLEQIRAAGIQALVETTVRSRPKSP